MREIKFRVWNGSEMEYSVMAGCGIAMYVNSDSGSVVDPNDSASITSCNTIYPEGAPLMQFTGFKNDDGKEVYEDDIFSDIETEFEHYLAKVHYDDSQGKYVLLDWRGEYAGDLDEWSNCPIVGNIHQNPELLN